MSHIGYSTSSNIAAWQDGTLGLAPTVSGGHTCAKCLQFVEHGSTHSILSAENRCVTVPTDGPVVSYSWPVTKPDGESHKVHGSHFKAHHVGRHSVKPMLPHRHSRSVLENAARELAGTNGHLESYRHHEDEEYVTVELIVRKDRA